MSENIFIERFFESQFELMEISNEQERNVNTLYSFLNNLHGTADRLKVDFKCDIKKYPEFKILRLIRNYLHHVGDISEIRLNVVLQPNVSVYHSEHLIISMHDFAKSIRSFIDTNTVQESNRSFKKKQKFMKDEFDSIMLISGHFSTILSMLDDLIEKPPRVKLDGVIYELGFDIYKYIYNITNFISDECRGIKELSTKSVIVNLEETYTEEFNIPKNDMLTLPGLLPFLTTKGFVFAEKVAKV